jgi:23S rRNA (adenine2503-C2)-methyltransferase
MCTLSFWRKIVVLKFKDVFYLPSGRIFLLETEDGYPIECTEMRDVLIDSKEHNEVRTTLDPKIIWRHLQPYNKKWLLTVSTQKGCPHDCQFCDVAPLPFKGNLTQEEILGQVDFLLENTLYAQTEKAKIGFARMGEPAHNLENVLGAMRMLVKPPLRQVHEIMSHKRNYSRNKWLPCFNSILPKKTIEGIAGEDVLRRVIEFKEKECDGFLHLQISCNSTDENTRQRLFGGASVLALPQIIEIVNQYEIVSRTVTLNFIVMRGVEVNVNELVKMGLNANKFAIKLIPLNKTENGEKHNLETFANYDNYDDLKRLAAQFQQAGLPVVYDAIAKCEEAGLCCGQLAHINI